MPPLSCPEIVAPLTGALNQTSSEPELGAGVAVLEVEVVEVLLVLVEVVLVELVLVVLVLEVLEVGLVLLIETGIWLVVSSPRLE